MILKLPVAEVKNIHLTHALLNGDHLKSLHARLQAGLGLGLV